MNKFDNELAEVMIKIRFTLLSIYHENKQGYYAQLVFLWRKLRQILYLDQAFWYIEAVLSCAHIKRAAVIDGKTSQNAA